MSPEFPFIEMTEPPMRSSSFVIHIRKNLGITFGSFMQLEKYYSKKFLNLMSSSTTAHTHTQINTHTHTHTHTDIVLVPVS